MQTLALYVECVCVWCVPTTIVWICIECELFKRFVIILSCRHAYLWSKQWAMRMCAPSGAFERHFQFLIVVVDRRREWTPNHWQELIMLMAYPHITLLAGIFQRCSCIQCRVRHAFRPIPDICVALHFKANTFISTLTMTITNPLHSISTQFQSHLECLISETGEAQQKLKKKDCNRILCVMKAPPTNTNRSMDTDTTLCQFIFAFHFNHVRNPTKIKATHVGLLCCVARVCNGTLHIHAARLFHHPKQMNSSNFDYTFFLFLHSRTLSDWYVFDQWINHQLTRVRSNCTTLKYARGYEYALIWKMCVLCVCILYRLDWISWPENSIICKSAFFKTMPNPSAYTNIRM